MMGMATTHDFIFDPVWETGFWNSLINRRQTIRHSPSRTTDTVMPNLPDSSGPATHRDVDAPVERARYWIARLVAKDITETELDSLEAWLAADPGHARAFARERALWQDLGAVADALAAPVAAPLPPERPGRRRGRGWPALSRRRLVRAAPAALAASIAAALFLPSLILDIRADHRTAAGEVRSVALPDGTVAMLDSDSAISVMFDGERRMVRLLAGRAWFDVRHQDRPFLVEALGGKTRDIGTGFEVRRDGGTVEVGVTQGAVEVHTPGKAAGPTLRAGERARYSAHGVEKLTPRSAARLAAWRNGELLFDEQPVEAVIAEIARYRRAPVWTVGDFGGAAPISGLFLIARPEEALETVAGMRGLRLTTLPGGIVVVRPDSGG